MQYPTVSYPSLLPLKMLVGSQVKLKTCSGRPGAPPEIIADLASVKCRRSATHKVFLLCMVTVRFGFYVDLHASIGLRSRGSLCHCRIIFPTVVRHI
jgi:hypothetical protein